jgi:hypothetical protein
VICEDSNFGSQFILFDINWLFNKESSIMESTTIATSKDFVEPFVAEFESQLVSLGCGFLKKVSTEPGELLVETEEYRNGTEMQKISNLFLKKFHLNMDDHVSTAPSATFWINHDQEPGVIVNIASHEISVSLPTFLTIRFVQPDFASFKSNLWGYIDNSLKVNNRHPYFFINFDESAISFPCSQADLAMPNKHHIFIGIDANKNSSNLMHLHDSEEALRYLKDIHGTNRPKFITLPLDYGENGTPVQVFASEAYLTNPNGENLLDNDSQSEDNPQTNDSQALPTFTPNDASPTIFGAHEKDTHQLQRFNEEDDS